MNLISLSQWLSATPLSQLIQRTSWAIPGIQVVHILCLATLFALALNLSLRVAGRGFVAESLASLAGRFVPAMWICLALLLGERFVAHPRRARSHHHEPGLLREDDAARGRHRAHGLARIGGASAAAEAGARSCVRRCALHDRVVRHHHRRPLHCLR